jgi:hypothetical protein
MKREVFIYLYIQYKFIQQKKKYSTSKAKGSHVHGVPRQFAIQNSAKDW